MKLKYEQQGATLFVALILLLVMTLFAISSINMSTTNLKIVSNMQAVEVLDAEANAALEQVISQSSSFTSPAATTIASTYGTINVDAPVCIDSQPASGYSALHSEIIPEDNTWEVVASITDTVTGATSTMHSGIKMRMLAGNCP